MAAEAAPATPIAATAPAGALGGAKLNPNGQWYMLIGEENHGPYTTDEMTSWFADGAVAPECWVSVDGGDWKEAKDLLAGAKSGSGGGGNSGSNSDGTATKDEWYMLVGEEQHGPYTLAELQGWVAEGAVAGETYVSNGGDWVMAKDA